MLYSNEIYLSDMEFVSVETTCALLQLSYDGLMERCGQLNIKPEQNILGETGFVQPDLQRLCSSFSNVNLRKLFSWPRSQKKSAI